MAIKTIAMTGRAQASNGVPVRHGTNYLVEANNGSLYHVYIDTAASSLSFTKSDDGGLSWGKVTGISSTASIVYLSVWYDRWSGINGDLIHIAFIETSGHDVLYRNINTASSDTIATQRTIFAGTSSAAGGTLSITRTRGGNLICGACIDAGAELFARKSTDVGVNWSDIAALSEATTDQVILLPGWAADNQDAMAFFWDADADEISRKLYDDSANSWAESSIATSMADVVASTSYPHFAAAVDITNSRNLLVAWSGVDASNADLRCWHVTESAITEVTNVVLNSVDDQGECAIGIDTSTDYWYVFYGGKSDGSETWNTAVNVYMKVSQDSGATWGAETLLTAYSNGLQNLYCCPRFTKKYGCVMIHSEGMYGTFVYVPRIIVDVNLVRATFQLGI